MSETGIKKMAFFTLQNFNNAMKENISNTEIKQHKYENL
ncbi:hypothetical protein ADIARSV_3419 [Arcticibacter svalbardensis MN12-7]|uniref:Uncharacterized protein n=1 Tax=Arcticibacter svalbardensis MN12-7 TaxID=1150600 RepID=R9GP74_9SPHI|nr:hypothetical protein ADIARSV_3419 [Arcticibacter svalbardensis MN12-7]